GDHADADAAALHLGDHVDLAGHDRELEAAVVAALHDAPDGGVEGVAHGAVARLVADLGAAQRDAVPVAHHAVHVGERRELEIERRVGRLDAEGLRHREALAAVAGAAVPGAGGELDAIVAVAGGVGGDLAALGPAPDRHRRHAGAAGAVAHRALEGRGRAVEAV